MNVGIYRGMVAGTNRIPILMWRAQHIGHHVTAWQSGGNKEMPIAVAIGWEPSLGFVGGSPVPKGMCEYDVMGAIRGAPVELVKCETVDLYVPATAEIVIEGYLGLDPETYMMEGPYAEFTGYLAGDRSPKPTIRVTAITHRNDPILRGTIEGSHAGQLFRERRLLVGHARGDRVERARPRRRAGHHRRVVPAGAGRHQRPGAHEAELSRRRPSRPPTRSGALPPRMCATSTSPWSTTTSTSTITPRSIGRSRYRVNAGENDIVIMPATFGAGLDPSTRRRDRNAALFGTGKWNRVLIDATINLDYDPDPDLGGARFPPTVWPEQKDIDAVMKRWGELGLDKRKR